ncbi:MAG: transcriptional repressor LexA [Desulfobacteraceae bacterium]|nr:transcriptional repressor LexA [Desulfobacteraceae bacterium]MDH3574513.1 transcriptional repressor LexA [Desulfobacteraceae bacterium]MDH3721927.1 transcriptional repressor LexA [Desulfobacteraceae bacterium]MDH3837220.1 transcriptional repressor LexA [Desulfobacteraceae bacterium]MDH3873928.1 transcriptional repressor LexA [Desulfobacteraceae bacterium]
MQTELTPKQQRFFNYLEREIIRTGKAPSLRQSADEMGVSHAAISQLITALEKKEILKRDGRYSRTIHLLNPIRKTAGIMRWREIPIVGEIAAGLPLYAQQEWGGSVVIDSTLYRGPNLFALWVKGESMRDAAILDGDLVICEPRQFAEDGEIVVALINQEEATVKRFFRRKRYIELRPENPAYKPVRYDFNEILVQGKVIGVQRGPEGIDKA